jgi:hypothetical protein
MKKGDIITVHTILKKIPYDYEHEKQLEGRWVFPLREQVDNDHFPSHVYIQQPLISPISVIYLGNVQARITWYKRGEKREIKTLGGHPITASTKIKDYESTLTIYVGQPYFYYDPNPMTVTTDTACHPQLYFYDYEEKE